MLPAVWSRVTSFFEGPTRSEPTNEPEPQAQSIERSLTSVARLSNTIGGAGLEEGRLPQGVSRIIEDYLARRHSTAGSDTVSLAPQRDQMLDSLANFAEKVLFVANNEQLVGQRRQMAALQGLLNAQDNTTAYVRLLQAIGNSILIEVDELRHLDRHVEDEMDLASVEANILSGIKTTTTLKGPATTQPAADLASALDLDGLIESTKAPAARASQQKNQRANRKQVIDRLITKLEYEEAQALIRDGPDAEMAKRLKSALEVLYQRRSNMIFIRPPAAFLRDSYPVTALQSNPSGLWTNELSREAARGMPFAETVRDLIYPRAKQDAETQRNIDKVFWQNINRIRVAGSGRTNYVMVKDDVGNWYVKGYSADPRDIIESAKEMATFAIGQPVQSDALEAGLKQTNSAALQDQKQQASQSASQGNQGKGGATSTKPSRAQATTQNTALGNFRENEFAQVTKSYISALADLNDRIVAEARQLEDAVNLAWATDQLTDPGLAEISHCAGEQLKAALKPTTRASDSADQLSDKIQANATAIKSFRDDVLKGIYSLATPQPAQPGKGGGGDSAPAAASSAARASGTSRGPEVRPVMLDVSPTNTTTPAQRPPDAGAPRPSAAPAPTAAPTTAPTTHPTGCQGHTALTLTDPQKREAFKVSADTVRTKLQPLVRDASAAIERYQAQLSVISGK